MTVDIICPLYNARNYIMDLHQNIKKQKNVEVLSINYVVTKTNDNIEEILESLDCNYEMIEREEFSHSLTRERMANKCKADIIVFITQDVIIKSESWLKNLIRGIEENECEAAFSRQICTNSTIEKYTREREEKSDLIQLVRALKNRVDSKTYGDLLNELNIGSDAINAVAEVD